MPIPMAFQRCGPRYFDTVLARSATVELTRNKGDFSDIVQLGLAFTFRTLGPRLAGIWRGSPSC